MSIAKGGIGRAAVGGILFGGAGAIVGASTRKQKEVCDSLQVKVTVKGYKDPAFFIKLISTGTKKALRYLWWVAYLHPLEDVSFKR